MKGMIQSVPFAKRWTRQEWYRLTELGFFPEGCRTELIEGEILVMSPQGASHSLRVQDTRPASAHLVAGRYEG